MGTGLSTAPTLPPACPLCPQALSPLPLLEMLGSPSPGASWLSRALAAALCPISPITSPLSGGLLGLAEPFALALNCPDPSTTPLMRLSPPFAGWHWTPCLNQHEAAAGLGLGRGWGQGPPVPTAAPGCAASCRCPSCSFAQRFIILQ